MLLVSSRGAWHIVALQWHGDIHSAEPQLGPGDSEEAAVMGMCWGHHLLSSFSSIQAFSIEQGTRLGHWDVLGMSFPQSGPPALNWGHGDEVG